MSEAAVKMAVHRLRQRYRQCLRAEIAQTIATRPKSKTNCAMSWGPSPSKFKLPVTLGADFFCKG